MLLYIGRRLVLMIPVLLGVTILAFAILQFIPGDPAEAILGEEFDAEIAAEIERLYGLDKPVWLNLSRWVDTGVVVAQEYVGLTDVQFTVSDASSLEVGQDIHIGNETMKIQQIIGNTLVVQRGTGPGEEAGLHRVNADILVRGFSNPFDSQYFHFLSNAVRFNFGRSIRSGDEIAPVLIGRFAFTFQLSLLSIMISVLIGVMAGVISATRQYSFFDNASMLTALAGISTPIFVTGLVLILIFAVLVPRYVPWWPEWAKLAAGRFVDWDGTVKGLLQLWVTQPGEVLRHLFLPALALGINAAAVIARMTRASMLEVIRQDYIRTARAYGVHERTINYKHALKNALIPVVTVLGLEFGINLGGAVLTETVFALPGLGRYIVQQGILTRDYPIVQAGILLVALVFILINLITDLTYAFIDPRIRYQ